MTLQARFSDLSGGACPVFIADMGLHEAPFNVSFRNIGLRDKSQTIWRKEVLFGNDKDSGARRSNHFRVPGVKLAKWDKSTERHKWREQTGFEF